MLIMKMTLCVILLFYNDCLCPKENWVDEVDGNVLPGRTLEVERGRRLRNRSTL